MFSRWRARKQRNPLLRKFAPIERVGLGAVVVLCIALAAGVVAAVMVASMTTRAAVANSGKHYQVTARVLSSKVADPQLALGVPGAVPYSERLRWTWQGHPHQDSRTVTVADAPGSGKRIWVDQSGDIATAPPHPGDVAIVSGLVGVGAGLLALTVMAFAVALLRGWLLRRRMHDWQGEWEQVAPLWTGYSGRY